MLTRLSIRNFKLFDEVEIELGDRVVLIGPNNAGKTTALQALALWDIGLKRWIEKRGSGDVPTKRPGVTINRKDLIAVPVPAANLLWRDLHVRSGKRTNGKTRTENILVEIIVDGVNWSCGLEFDYANEESFYCRPLRADGDKRMAVPQAASDVRIAYLPPMSGLAANERRIDRGAVNVALGEGRTAEVLRNLCYQILESEDGEAKWGGNRKPRRGTVWHPAGHTAVHSGTGRANHGLPHERGCGAGYFRKWPRTAANAPPSGAHDRQSALSAVAGRTGRTSGDSPPATDLPALERDGGTDRQSDHRGKPLRGSS